MFDQCEKFRPRTLNRWNVAGLMALMSGMIVVDSAVANDFVYYPGIVSSPTYVAPAYPVTVAPQPIYVEPTVVHYQPVVVQQPVVVTPAPVVYQAPYYYPTTVAVVSQPVVASPFVPARVRTRHHHSLFGRYDWYRYEVRTPYGKHKYKWKVDHWDGEVEYKYDFDD